MNNTQKLLRVVLALIPFGILIPKIIEERNKPLVGGNSGMEIPILEIISIGTMCIVVIFLLISSIRNRESNAKFNLSLLLISIITYIFIFNHFNLYK